MKKDLILTFDYELFLGKKCGTIINTLIRPTQLILEILQQNNAKAIFFVDATWLLFLKKNYPEDLKMVSAQLKDIIRQGSSVELHLHPQWFDACIKEDVIGFETIANYKLHTINPLDRIDIFRTTIDLLESITLQKIRCFRAGGFCIEPFEQLKQAFEIFKIKYDFSLAPGVYLRSGHQYDFDFSDAPELLYYSFQNNVKVPDSRGNFIEFPLSTYYNNPLYRVSNNLLLKLNNDRIQSDGISIQKELSILSRLISKKLGFSKTFLTIDQMSNIMLKWILSHHFRNTPLLVILSHPKNLSDQLLVNLTYLSSLCNTLNTEDLDGIIINGNIEQTSLVFYPDLI